MFPPYHAVHTLSAALHAMNWQGVGLGPKCYKSKEVLSSHTMAAKFTQEPSVRNIIKSFFKIQIYNVNWIASIHMPVTLKEL